MVRQFAGRSYSKAAWAVNMKNKMEKIMITMMTMVCLVSLVSAYYPGETVIFENEFGITDLAYTVTHNSSSIGNIVIVINSTNITITFPQDMTPDSFDLVFFEEEVREVEKIVYRDSGSSSGGGTRYVNRTVNHTIYVPEYVDKVVEVLSECDKCTNEVIDIFPIAEEDDRNNWKIFLGGLLFFVIICFLFWLFSDRGKSKYGHIEPVNSLPNKQEGYDGR